MIGISEEALRDVARLIERWGEKLKDARQNKEDVNAMQFYGWLYGAEATLSFLGLKALSAAAADAQKEVTK